MKKRVYKSLFILLTLCLVFFLFGCKKEEQERISIDGKDVAIYTIHTEAQDNYLAGDYTQIGTYANGVEELSKPNGIKLSWKENSKTYYVIIEDMETSDIVLYPSQKKEIEVYNLKINTVYEWIVTKSNGDVLKKDYFIIQEDCVRNLNIEGVTNARDLGGWKTSDGKTVKQGMLYRTSKFNDDESTDLLITQKGVDVLVHDLKIKTEIDLRTIDDNESGGITESPLGDNVKYISFPMESGGNIMRLNKDKMADLFEILANEDNYPICYHCSIGTDRTGFVSFVINALLGVSDDDLQRDYLFSNFGNIGKPRTTNALESNYYSVLDAVDGANTSEKMYNWLINQGVEKVDIDKVIEIMKK